MMLPPADTELKPGDRILFVGRRARPDAGSCDSCYEPGVFDYVRTGVQTPRGLVFRRLAGATGSVEAARRAPERHRRAVAAAARAFAADPAERLH